MQKNSLLLYIGLALLGATLITSGYLGVRQGILERQIAKYQALVEGISEETPEIDPLQIAKQTLTQIGATQTYWSQVVPEIDKTIPIADTGEQKVIFSSFSTSEDGRISITGVTRPHSSHQLADLSETIRAFNDHPGFVEVFVPSLSLGVSEGGQVYNFSLTISHKKQPTNIPRT